MRDMPSVQVPIRKNIGRTAYDVLASNNALAVLAGGGVRHPFGRGSITSPVSAKSLAGRIRFSAGSLIRD